MVLCCQNELFSIGLPTYRIKDIKYSSAYRKFGYCKKDNRRKEAIIGISEMNFYSTKDCLRNTVLHELLHAMDNTRGHDLIFRRRMSLVNDRLAANVSITATKKETDTAYAELKNQGKRVGVRRQPIKYLVRCESCGFEYGYKRETKLIRLLRRGSRHSYYCPKCRGRRFSLADLK